MTCARAILTAFFVSQHYFSYSCSDSFDVTIDASRGINDYTLETCYLRTDPTATGVVQRVNVSVLVLDIDQINESLMSFRLNCYFNAWWKNHRMNITVVNQTGEVALPPKLHKCMWKPGFCFPNTNDIKTFMEPVPFQGYSYHESEGYIHYFQRFIFHVSCPMKFAMFPFDTQHCQFMIGLTVNSDDQVLLDWKKDSDNGFSYVYEMHPLQFSISKPTLDSLPAVFFNRSYTSLVANISFYRLLTGSFLNYYIPSSLVVILSWISFYIDVEAAPARVTLGVTAVLTISTQMIQARNSLPAVQYVTCMDVWLFFCLTLVFASIIEYSIVYSYQSQCKKKATAISKPRGNTVKVIENKRAAGWTSNDETVQTISKLASTSANMDRISRWLFPIVMLIFSISYFAFAYCNTEIKLG